MTIRFIGKAPKSRYQLKETLYLYVVKMTFYKLILSFFIGSFPNVTYFSLVLVNAGAFFSNLNEKCMFLSLSQYYAPFLEYLFNVCRRTNYNHTVLKIPFSHLIASFLCPLTKLRMALCSLLPKKLHKTNATFIKASPLFVQLPPSLRTYGPIIKFLFNWKRQRSRSFPCNYNKSPLNVDGFCERNICISSSTRVLNSLSFISAVVAFVCNCKVKSVPRLA